MDYIYKDADKLLSDYYTRKLSRRIKYRREELSSFKHDPYELGVRVQTTRRKDGLENQAIRNVEDKGIRYLQAQLNVVEAFIKHLDQETQTILYLHYSKNVSYTNIAKRIGYSVETVRRKRLNAAKELEEWLE